MWVSRKRWDALQVRVSFLEEEMKQLRHLRGIDFIEIFEYMPPDTKRLFPRSAKIHLHRAMHELCRRIGVRLEYKAGSPECVEFVKEPKK